MCNTQSCTETLSESEERTFNPIWCTAYGKCIRVPEKLAARKMLASCTSRVCGRPSWIFLRGEECSKAHTCKAALPIMYNMQQPSSSQATTSILNEHLHAKERSAACWRCKHWRYNMRLQFQAANVAEPPLAARQSLILLAYHARSQLSGSRMPPAFPLLGAVSPSTTASVLFSPCLTTGRCTSCHTSWALYCHTTSSTAAIDNQGDLRQRSS
jgi:hypothetical protein